MSALFTPIQLRGTEVRNRVWVSPMCQYSAHDGLPTDWHLVHLGSFARGGAGMVFTEATAVLPEGRISPQDTGIWSDAHRDAWTRIADFVRAQGATPGMQLAHAGRKASTRAPWTGRGPVPDDDGGWQPSGPSALAFPGLRQDVRAMTIDDVHGVVTAFRAATSRAVEAGFEAVEVHAAHGYLLHEFLSPLSNQRDDDYGGSYDGRTRLLLEVVRSVRDVLGDDRPLVVRISATEWTDGGWTVEDSVRLAPMLRDSGADLVDCSSGGNVADAEIPVGPGYQVDLARRVRAEGGIATGAVGMITDPAQAEQVVASGSADVVLLARALLRDPHWALRAAHELDVEVGKGIDWPDQYLRAVWP